MTAAPVCCTCLRCGNLIELDERARVCGPGIGLVVALAFPERPAVLLVLGLN